MSIDWVLRTDASIDGNSLSYMDRMERNSAEERRRQREKVMMDQGLAVWKAKKEEELELEIKDREEIRELSSLKQFGRPGHGAPMTDNRKKVFTEHQFADKERSINHMRALNTNQSLPLPSDVSSYDGGCDVPDLSKGSDFLNELNLTDPTSNRSKKVENFDNDSDPHSALSFGRPGYGAPVRTKSGRVRTQLKGNADIRFQNNEAVQKTINNAIRYHTDPETKAQYSRELDEQILERQQLEREQKEKDLTFAKHMGWCTSGDPRKRISEVRTMETEDMKKEMDELKAKKQMEETEAKTEVGVELVPLLKEKSTGRPRKDPVTGYLKSHALHSTDVTKLANIRTQQSSLSSYENTSSPNSQSNYSQTLETQVKIREKDMQQSKIVDQEDQKRHFESWDSYWGRPGGGAPKQGGTAQKENLMKMLHYTNNEDNTIDNMAGGGGGVDNQINKAPNNLELITLERLSVK